MHHIASKSPRKNGKEKGKEAPTKTSGASKGWEMSPYDALKVNYLEHEIQSDTGQRQCNARSLTAAD